MSWCLATGSQRVLLRDVSMFTTALPWKRAWCSATRLGSARHGTARHGTAFNLPRHGTARSKHRFSYCCVACLQTSVSLRLLHGVNTSQYTYKNGAGIVTGYGLDGWGLIPDRGKIFFSSPQLPGLQWVLPGLLPNG
jgi:hypothetical protein